MKTGKKRPTSVIQQLGINLQDTNAKLNLLDILKSKSKMEPEAYSVDFVSSVCVPTYVHKDTPNIITNRCDDRLVVFTDGACSNNGSSRARAGYGVVWPYNRMLDVSKRLQGAEQTNNRAEFTALIEAQKIADKIDPTQEKPLYIYTDSELLVNSITKWLPGWKRNNWKKSDKKPVLNQDLLKEIDGNPRPLVFKHVRAHTGRQDWESIHNDEADRLARDAVKP